MISTVYLHPERTLRATWSVENDILTLQSFEEGDVSRQSFEEGDVSRQSFEQSTAHPSRSLSENASPTDTETLVLHTSKVLFHRYPVDAEEDNDRRRFFEIITCLPPLNAPDHIIDIAMPGQLHGSAWHGLFVIPHGAVPEGHTPSAMHVDILEDIRATRIAELIADAGITLLIGRRGDVWWCAVLDSAGTILHLVQTPAHELFEDAVEVRDLLLEVCGSMNIRAERVVLFGDTLTKSVLDATVVALDGLVTSVVRLNPFRTLRADVNAATQQRCVRLAHILGPLVGPLPCASLQES